MNLYIVFKRLKTMNLARFNFITNIVLICLLLVGGFVWADTNGVWHRAEDVRPGVFGADEEDGDYVFEDDLVIESTLETNRIENVNSGDNIVIVLG
jgi:hypothetical protein